MVLTKTRPHALADVSPDYTSTQPGDVRANCRGLNMGTISSPASLRKP